MFLSRVIFSRGTFPSRKQLHTAGARRHVRGPPRGRFGPGNEESPNDWSRRVEVRECGPTTISSAPDGILVFLGLLATCRVGYFCVSLRGEEESTCFNNVAT